MFNGRFWSFYTLSQLKKMCDAAGCLFADATAAVERMLHHRGDVWRVGPVGVTNEPKIAALRREHARTMHSGDGLFVAENGTLLIVVGDAERLPIPTAKQISDPTFLEHCVAGARRVLMVVRCATNTQTTKLLPTNASVLPWSLVLTDPLDHEIVPQQRRANPDELRAIGIDPGRPGLLPSIHASDPVVRYLGLVPGDVVRIVRRDGSLYFRHVIP